MAEPLIKPTNLSGFISVGRDMWTKKQRMIQYLQIFRDNLRLSSGTIVVPAKYQYLRMLKSWNT